MRHSLDDGVGRAAYWGERPQLFAAIADGPTPEERHLRVVKWFIVRNPSA